MWAWSKPSGGGHDGNHGGDGVSPQVNKLFNTWERRKRKTKWAQGKGILIGAILFW
jgi:hypothetical protein